MNIGDFLNSVSGFIERKWKERKFERNILEEAWTTKINEQKRHNCIFACWKHFEMAYIIGRFQYFQSLFIFYSSILFATLALSIRRRRINLLFHTSKQTKKNHEISKYKTHFGMHTAQAVENREKFIISTGQKHI